MRYVTIQRLAACAGALALTSGPALAQSIQVRVDGEPVRFADVQPQQIRERVMIPLRGVLEKLGAFVEWQDATNTVVATKDDKVIRLPIGSRRATVNGEAVYLDAPAMTVAGRTMVPLRFISESLGARVEWEAPTRTVHIDTTGQRRAHVTPADDRTRDYSRRAGDARRVVLPAGTVIPAQLSDSLSSRDSRQGDRFTATVRSGDDDAGLPSGTRIEGAVREAIPSREGKPGVIDVEFRSLIFPDGERVAIDGSLYSLDRRSVKRDESGRLVATGGGNERLKWVGIGAGAGLIIGAITRQNTLLSVLLGAGAGYLYDELRDKRPGDVSLGSGTDFGVKLDRSVSFRRDRIDYDDRQNDDRR